MIYDLSHSPKLDKWGPQVWALKAPTHLLHDRTNVCVCVCLGGWRCVFMYKDLFVLWHYVCVDEYKHTMTLLHDPP